MKPSERQRVSIAVPAHNEEHYIAACLQSLVNQKTSAELEIIVCLNACTDRTEQVVRKFANQHASPNIEIKVVHEPRKGVARARQRAFIQASGEIILSADADTEYEPDWVAKISADFQRDPQPVLVYGPIRFKDLHGLTGALLRYAYPALDLLAEKIDWAIGHPHVCGANFAVRKEAFGRVGGFDTSLEVFEDNELAHKLRELGPLYYDPRLVVYTSARRYSRYGFLWTIIYYTWSYLKLALFGRKPVGKFRDVRVEQ